MHFEDDVFVSYAHIDEENPVPGQPGWITALHEWLRVRLAQLLGKNPRIWRDPQLQGNQIIIHSIDERLPRVAVFISVLSPRYVKSESCKHELDQFVTISGISSSVAVADVTRVFKVVKTPVRREQEPQVLQPLRGYDFYVVEPQSGRTRELGPMSPPDVLQHYYSKLDDLAHDVAHVLTALEGDVAHDERLAPGGGTVYLAETTYDLQERRDAIRRELESQSYIVLPDRPLPMFGPDCQTFVRSQLDRCRMSIHMVGNNYGVVPEGSTESIVSMQHEQGLRRAAEGNFCCLTWMSPDLTPSDPRQQEFVSALQSDPRLQGGADLLRTPLEDFKTVIQIRLNADSDPAARTAVAAGPKLVYVICDSRDREQVPAIEQLLFEHQVNVICSAFDGDEASVRRDHEESLLACDAVLIYYGAGGDLWFRSKLRDLQKIAGYGRTRPLLAKAVFVVPPLTPAKSAIRLHDTVVVSGERPSSELFAPFLSRLQ